MTKWIFLFLTILFSLYVLVYFCIIDRSQSESIFVGNYEYKLKWHACETIFYPINKLDYIIRPDYLKIGITESGDFIWLNGEKVNDWQ